MIDHAKHELVPVTAGDLSYSVLDLTRQLSQWRNVDDALDSASSQDNIFGAFASFLGGKGNVLRQLNELDYKATYTLEG